MISRGGGIYETPAIAREGRGRKQGRQARAHVYEYTVGLMTSPRGALASYYHTSRKNNGGETNDSRSILFTYSFFSGLYLHFYEIKKGTCYNKKNVEDVILVIKN